MEIRTRAENALAAHTTNYLQSRNLILHFKAFVWVDDMKLIERNYCPVIAAVHTQFTRSLCGQETNWRGGIIINSYVQLLNSIIKLHSCCCHCPDIVFCTIIIIIVF